MSKRRSRPCRACRRIRTQSITGFCADCRPADAHPAVYRDGPMVTFAGITLTTQQAINLANEIVDATEKDTTP